MKKFLSILFVLLFFVGFFSPKSFVFAEDEQGISYLVYDCNMENVLFERIDVSVGDIFIDKDFKQYKVYLVDEREHYAKAELIGEKKRLGVTKKSLETIGNRNIDKKICLYMTHNDESYIKGDGTDSVYGEGGIHDVANRLAYELKQRGINIVIDETLHIPHNSTAYSRSAVTAKKLLEQNPNAIFDIHRDGVARSAYVTKVNGEERCKVRIVVGGANPNKEKNLEFALYLMTVAESVCPWLFADIYYASGKYNQDLSSKALLFEMGTYTAEKDLVLKSVPELAKVIDTTLFSTSIDDDGNLVIGSDDYANTIDNVLAEKKNNEFFPTIFLILILLGAVGTLVWFFIKFRKQKFN